MIQEPRHEDMKPTSHRLESFRSLLAQLLITRTSPTTKWNFQSALLNTLYLNLKIIQISLQRAGKKLKWKT